jgi:phage shock protein A
MKLFHRIHIQIRSGIEELLNRVEDHEAMALAAIEQCQRHHAQARMKRAHLQTTLRQQQERVIQLRHDEARWKTRAATLAGQDRPKALLCVERMKQAQQQAAALESELKGLEQALLPMNQAIHTLELRIAELKRRKAQLAVREHCQVATDWSPQPGEESTKLMEVFDRWEVRLASRDGIFAEGESADTLEHEFLKNENQDILESELDRLIAEQNEKGAQA